MFKLPFTALFLFLIIAQVGYGQLSNFKKKSPGKILCERMADQCQSACSTYWSVCHKTSSGGGSSSSFHAGINSFEDDNAVGHGALSPTRQTAVVDATIQVGATGILRPNGTDCSDYRSRCDAFTPCCRGYNCRFNPDNSGSGTCH